MQPVDGLHAFQLFRCVARPLVWYSQDKLQAAAVADDAHTVAGCVAVVQPALILFPVLWCHERTATITQWTGLQIVLQASNLLFSSSCKESLRKKVHNLVAAARSTQNDRSFYAVPLMNLLQGYPR